jgi:acyl-CoA hydrolase
VSTNLAGRRVAESLSEFSEIVLPNDANPLGTLFGGKLMQLVDMAASLAAMRHSRCPVVTASIDSMTFLYPIRIGQLVLLKSSVNRVFHTSMEVGVKVFVENPLTGDVHHTSSAYLTFVAIDRDGNRVEVPPVIPETKEEIRRHEEAAERRRYRLQQRRRS